MLKKIRQFMAIEAESISTAEKLVASLGGLIGISLISIISFQFTGASGAALIVPSMGASAVLVFAVPHGKLSQPWPLIAGNLISAVAGVTCYKLIPDTFLAAGVAVGLAIGLMHLFSCIHPPGGATALAAVIGGPAINSLGYEYVLTPILLNVMIIFIIAVAFNSLFPWRRYPGSAMMRFTDQIQKQNKPQADSDVISKHAIEQAMSDMDLVMDITTEDLQRVIQLSLHHAKHQQITAQQIKLNHFYTNGCHGPDWSVRRIIDESTSSDAKNDLVIYRVVEGDRFNTADSCSREEFARWAAREVYQNTHES